MTFVRDATLEFNFIVVARSAPDIDLDDAEAASEICVLREIVPIVQTQDTDANNAGSYISEVIIVDLHATEEFKRIVVFKFADVEDVQVTEEFREITAVTFADVEDVHVTNASNLVAFPPDVDIGFELMG